MIDVASVALRALSLLLLLQALGIALFSATFGPAIPASLARTRRAGQTLAVTAMIAVTAHYVLEAGRMAGEISGVLDLSLQRTLWDSSNGAAFASRLAGLILVLAGLTGAWRPIVFLGAILASMSFALTGHTAVHTHRGLLAALLTLHVLIVAFWFGALWPLAVASLRETSAGASRVIERFTAMATWLVPLILVAGAVMAALLLPSVSALREPYGRLLLSKVVGFALLMGLAAANKWRLGPALASAGDRAGRRFRRSLAAEFVLIAAVLTITTVMTSLFSPEVPSQRS